MPWKKRRAEGKMLRRATPRESHAVWKPGKNRPDQLKLLAESNRGRQVHLVPLRMGRMAASPFAFLRGSACVMAADLSTTPISGIPVVIDGDAHLNNCCMHGTPQREVVFDLNDFDEAVIGPWEWDLKRLTASVNVAGRQNGLNRGERAAAVRRCVKGYRFNARLLQDMEYWTSGTCTPIPEEKIPSSRQTRNRKPCSVRLWPRPFRFAPVRGEFCQELVSRYARRGRQIQFLADPFANGARHKGGVLENRNQAFDVIRLSVSFRATTKRALSRSITIMDSKPFALVNPASAICVLSQA